MDRQDRKVERRLAAILAADVVGAAGLMEADESGTLSAIRTIYLKSLNQPPPSSGTHGQDHGRWSTPGIRQPRRSCPLCYRSPNRNCRTG